MRREDFVSGESKEVTAFGRLWNKIYADNIRN